MYWRGFFCLETLFYTFASSSSHYNVMAIDPLLSPLTCAVCNDNSCGFLLLFARGLLTLKSVVWQQVQPSQRGREKETRPSKLFQIDRWAQSTVNWLLSVVTDYFYGEIRITYSQWDTHFDGPLSHCRSASVDVMSKNIYRLGQSFRKAVANLAKPHCDRN